MNFGIKAVEIYFPNQCVDQAELEKFDGVSQGKYTIGLGQKKMSFCDDREDIYSLALTAVSSLLSKYSVDPKSIGRLEVGTETILDKSKSVKSVLMQLFAPHGNTNVEGVDTVNACYGGTNAFFNTLNWLESSAWDGRDAIVVAGDIALYKKGNARPTGGAGCVAMLLGPNAPIVAEPGLRGSYITHAYDFYKPDLTSEYPYLDGQYSLRCYAEALTACYKAYNEREQVLKSKAGVNGHANGSTNGASNGAVAPLEVPLDKFDYMAFHAPTCKTVAKSYSRLLYNDYLADQTNTLFGSVPATIQQLSPAESLTDKVLEKTFLGLSSKRFAARVQPSIQVPTNTGNMYCASVWSGLVSLLTHVAPTELVGKRIGLFSYGSGLASSLFSLKVASDAEGALTEIARKLDVPNRLAARQVVPPQTYDDMCNLRERAHLKKDYAPAGGVEALAKGTWYLTKVDDMFRRSYEIKQ